MKKIKDAFLLSVSFVQSWVITYELKAVKMYEYFFIYEFLTGTVMR